MHDGEFVQDPVVDKAALDEELRKLEFAIDRLIQHRVTDPRAHQFVDQMEQALERYAQTNAEPDRTFVSACLDRISDARHKLLQSRIFRVILGGKNVSEQE